MRLLRAFLYQFFNRNKYLNGLKYAESLSENKLCELVDEIDYYIDQDDFDRAILDYKNYTVKAGEL